MIQTRKNNSDVGVANRQQWVVQPVEDDGALSVRETGSGRKRQRTVRLPAEYVAEHTHLSYAATAYGVQGATVAGSHTILTDQASAAGVYVGMTRGRESNVLHIVAENQAEARAQFIEAMKRDRADRGLTDATRRAVEEVAGLVKTGPVRFVNDEIAALDKRAATAEAQAARWQQVSTALADLHARETEVRETARATEQAAQQQAEQVRVEVTAPIISAARTALAEWQQAEVAEQAAGEQVRRSSWFGKRRARDEHENAKTRTHEARQQLASEWGELPRWNDRADIWVKRVTRPKIDTDPRVVEAEKAHRAARDEVLSMPERAQTARLAAFGRVFGAEKVFRNRTAYLSTNPAQRAQTAAQTAKCARAEAELLQSLTPAEAVARIEQTRAVEAEREAQQEEQRRAALYDPSQHRATPGQAPPDYGRSL